MASSRFACESLPVNDIVLNFLSLNASDSSLASFLLLQNTNPLTRLPL